MANNNSDSEKGAWGIVAVIAFILYAWISAQTPSSRVQHEHNNGYDIHVGGE